MTVLITGAAGFIGYSVAQHLLARGDDVLGIDNLNPYYDVKLKRARLAQLQETFPDRFTFAKIDFARMSKLEQGIDGKMFDRIIHLGAQAGVRYSMQNPRAYIEANIIGHFNILEIARQRQVEHMVYASSSSVYGANVEIPFSVDHRADQPVSLYAATKRADELLSETYSHLHRLPQTGLRFFTVYGPWGRPDMMPWLFTSAILAGLPIRLYNDGNMARDFTFIDDIVAGVIATFDRAPTDDRTVKPGGSTSPHAIYNIGNSRPESLRRVLGIIEQACGKSAIIECMPMPAGDVPRTWADIDAIQNDFAYTPTTSVDEGLPRFVRWYQEYISN